MEKIQFAIESFKNIQELIRFTDQKSGAVLVIAGLIFTALIDSILGLEFVGCSDWNLFSVLTFVFGLSSIVTLAIVLYISIFKVLKPRLAQNYEINDYSLFYYEHLAFLGKENIQQKYNDLDNSEMLKQINEQQFEVSNILKEKTKSLGMSFSVLFFSIISFVLFLLTSKQV